MAPLVAPEFPAPDCVALVVDDELIIRKLLNLVLREKGVKVLDAENGEEGWKQFLAHSPDLVITDIRMPRMDGLELLKRIRTVSSRTEVIVVTGFAETDVVVSALRSGASNFIEKPFEQEELQRQLFASLDRCRLVKETERLGAELARERRNREMSGRMATVGRLMAGLAHEIHNPLTFLKGNAELVRRMLAPRSAADPEYDEVIALLNDVEFGARRIADLVAALRRFGAASESPMQPVPAADIMADCVRLVRAQRPKGIEFSVEPPPAGVLIKVRPVEMESCLMNLLVNAFEAVGPGGGSVRFSAETMQEPHGTEWLEFRVEDNGPGISAARMEELFTPSITEKRNGMGLGLSIAYDAAKRNDAEIDIDSAPGRGTTARVRLMWNKEIGIEPT